MSRGRFIIGPMPSPHSTLSGIETPHVVIDIDRVLGNVRRMQSLATASGVRLRPHIKTHKSLRLAAMQLEEGGTGITASKAGEALLFIEHGVPSVTVAYPLLDRGKLDRVLGAGKEHGTDVRLVADSNEGIDAAAAAARDLSIRLPVFLEIDVGLRRCGVRFDSSEALELTRRIDGNSSLQFAGLLSHAGHAYAAGGFEPVREIAAEERAMMLQLRERLCSAGIDVPEISVGSTPTVVASASFEGISEIRPGNYVFMDRIQLALGICAPDEIALTVVATIVSRNSDYLIVDAGSKVLSSDLGPHGSKGIEGYGVAFPLDSYGTAEGALQVAKLSEEHGFVRRDGADLPVGSRVRIVPNHACVVANLARSYLVVREDGRAEEWPVEASGLVR